MGLPRGSTIRLSPARRFMCDLMHASRQVPLVAIERFMPLAELIATRNSIHPKPSWFAIFLKAWALVAERRPELRQSYLSFPWPRLHQHACSVANLAVSRAVGETEAVLSIQIRRPEQMPLGDIDALIRRSRSEPVENFGDFRRILRVSRLPWFLRRLAWWAAFNVAGDWRARFVGTFGVTGVAALGAASLSLLSPTTTTITYGVFSPEGIAPVRLFYDHRVLDGVQPAMALQELEQILLGTIRNELRGKALAA
jgi:hypothetical protein